MLTSWRAEFDVGLMFSRCCFLTLDDYVHFETTTNNTEIITCVGVFCKSNQLKCLQIFPHTTQPNGTETNVTLCH